MRSMAFVFLLTVFSTFNGAAVPNEMPNDSISRATDSMTLKAPVAPKAQPEATSKAISPEPSQSIPSDTVTIPYDKAPTVISEGQAEYPRMARLGKFTATVTIKAYVDSTGTVRKAKAVKCTRPGMGFEEAAIKSAYGSKFKSATYKDRPVGIWYMYEVNFK